MIIDCHTHIGFGGAIVKSAEELLRSMDKSHIARALVFAGNINECPTERLVDAIIPHRDRLTAIGSVSPLAADRPKPERVRSWLVSGYVSGLKFYPGYKGEHWYPADEAARPYLEICADMGKPVIFHAGDLYDKVPGSKLKYAHPFCIDDIATDLPELKIVIAHLGWPYVREAAHVVSKNKNVYADVSGMVYGKFKPADVKRLSKDLKRFSEIAGGLDRVIYGSDWPICDQASYVATIRHVAPRRLKAMAHTLPAALFGLAKG